MQLSEIDTGYIANSHWNWYSCCNYDWFHFKISSWKR